MTKRDVPDDPLLKPASEAGWDEAEASTAVERDPAAPRRLVPKPMSDAKATAERLAELSRSAAANKPAIDAKIAEAKANAKAATAAASGSGASRPIDDATKSASASGASKPIDDATRTAASGSSKPADDATKAAAASGAFKPIDDATKASASGAFKPIDDATKLASASGAFKSFDDASKTAAASSGAFKPIDDATSRSIADAPATEARPDALAITRPDPDAALRDAIGAPPTRRRRATEHDDDELDGTRSPRSLRSIFLTIGGIVAVVVIGAFVVLGRLNTEHYALTCEAERAVPQQGRAFPPWGIHALSGDAWRPLKIAPETRCQTRETDDARALERWFLAMILDEVTSRLTSRDPSKLDETDALLKQALLLTRPPAVAEPDTLAAERTAQHKEIERMLGDVTYWRAAAKLRDAATTLSEAAKQFDAAAAQRPRHVSDAADWGAYARKLADQLRIGPSAGAPPSLGTAVVIAPAAEPSSPLDAPTPPRMPAPPGTALPVEPDKADKPDKPDAKADASKPEATKPDAPPTPPPPPTGGVLL